MVAGIIILFALIISLLDKPHLFQRPINFNKIIVWAILICSGIFSGVKEHQNSNDQEKMQSDLTAARDSISASKKTIDSLHVESRVLLVQVDTLRKENRNANTSYISILARYGLKVDSLSNSIIHQETEPTLTVQEAPVMDTAAKERKLNYTLTALNANAHITNIKYSLLAMSPDMKVVVEGPFVLNNSSLNGSSIISPNRDRDMILFLDRDIYIGMHTIITIEVAYKSKKGTPQPPLRKVYFIDKDPAKVQEAGSQLFNFIEDFLVSKKAWK